MRNPNGEAQISMPTLAVAGVEAEGEESEGVGALRPTEAGRRAREDEGMFCFLVFWFRGICFGGSGWVRKGGGAHVWERMREEDWEGGQEARAKANAVGGTCSA